MNEDKRTRIFNKAGGKCWYCGVELRPYQGEVLPDTFVTDHAHPKKFGGTSHESNLVPSCWKCNEVKKFKTIEQYRQYLAFEKAGVEKFTPNQIAWLRSHGIELPELPAITFYFEEMAAGNE